MAWVQSTFPVSWGDQPLFESASVTFDGTVTSGNCIVVFLCFTDQQGQIASITDNKGNTYTSLGAMDDTTGSSEIAQMYACFNCTGGAITVTAHWTWNGTNGPGTLYAGMLAAEYTNASAVDVSSFNAGNSTTATTNNVQPANITTTTAGDQIIGFFVSGNSTDEITAGTTVAYTRRETTYLNSSSYIGSGSNIIASMMFEDYIQPSAGAIGVRATMSASQRYVYGITSLKTGSTNLPSHAAGFVAAYHVASYTSTGSSKTITVTTQPGDYLVVYGGGENSGVTLNTPTGNSVSFALQTSVVTANHGTAYIWTGQDTTGGTNWTLTVTCAVSGNEWGASCVVFRGIAGFGATLSATTTGSVGLGNITTTADHSSIVVFMTDYNTADNTGMHHWQGLNGYSPTSGNGFEFNYGRDNTSFAYAYYGGYYPDAGRAGYKPIGVYFPDGMQASIVALEVKATPTYIKMPYVLDPSSLYELSETFDTYSNATAVTTASNPTKFTSVQSAASGTGVIDNTHTRSGSESLKITGTATSGNQFYVRYNFTTTTDQTYVRAAFYMTAYPSANSILMGITTVNDSGNIDQANVGMTTAGKIQLYDGGSLTSFTGGTVAMPLNQWFTLEYHLDWPNTQETVRAYDGSGSLIDTIATANGIYGGVRPNAVKIGVLGAPGTTTPAATLTYWLDSVAVSKTGWIGPA